MIDCKRNEVVPWSSITQSIFQLMVKESFAHRNQVLKDAESTLEKYEDIFDDNFDEDGGDATKDEDLEETYESERFVSEREKEEEEGYSEEVRKERVALYDYRYEST
jgi:hypothetical protein